MLSLLRSLPLGRMAFQFARLKLNTEVFSDLTTIQMATPELTKALILKPIHNHSRVSQRSLFHKKRVSGRIKTCFSEKKHKVFRRINKVKQHFYSNVLKQKIYATLSMKAYRCIKKMGSFDNYILCTKPKDLDSKFGEYLREIMLRKINDPDYRIPYIIGSNRRIRIKKYKRHIHMKEMKMVKISKEYKDNFRTFQKKFGNSVNELSNEDYKKYVELEGLKKTLGDELEPTHPLLVELKGKMKSNFSEEDLQKVREMSAQAEEDYLNEKHYKEHKRHRLEKAKRQNELLETKLKEMSFKIKMGGLEQ